MATPPSRLAAAAQPGPWRTALLIAAVTVLVGGLVVAFPRGENRRPYAAAAAATPLPAELRVSVAGAVQRPGPYSVSEGDRVEDLLELAGGALPDADLDRLSRLART
ncbi:MAG: SLBB domain-containing protein [Chloroflexi bacterium]|nr:SLBB domain-containing protein [Chloroflexota bacterium]